MYDLWDSDVVDWVRSDNPNFWDSGWTHIHRGYMFGIGFDTGAYYESEQNKFKVVRWGPELG